LEKNNVHHSWLIDRQVSRTPHCIALVVPFQSTGTNVITQSNDKENHHQEQQSITQDETNAPSIHHDDAIRTSTTYHHRPG
jgi:hypothetical protein